MRRLLFSGLVLGMATALAPAALAGDSANATATVMSSGSVHASHHSYWHGGGWYNGGRYFVRPAFYGYAWPGYWFKPSATYTFVADFALYGLPAPYHGYGWYRYKKDAYLMDAQGRIYDRREDIDWKKGKNKHHHHKHGHHAEAYHGPGDYEGRWTGTWQGADGTSYSGEYQGHFHGADHPHHAPDMPMAPEAGPDGPPPPPEAFAPPSGDTKAPYSYASVDPYRGVMTITTVVPPRECVEEKEVVYTVPAKPAPATKVKPRTKVKTRTK